MFLDGWVDGLLYSSDEGKAEHLCYDVLCF